MQIITGIAIAAVLIIAGLLALIVAAYLACEMCNGVMGQCKKKQRIEKARQRIWQSLVLTTF